MAKGPEAPGQVDAQKNVPQNPQDPANATEIQKVKKGADKFEKSLEMIDKLNKATEALKTNPTSKVKIDMMESEFKEIIGYYIDSWKLELAENLISITSKFIFNEVPPPKEHKRQIEEMTAHIQKIYPWEDIKIYYSRDFSSADSKAYWNIQISGWVIWFPIQYDEFIAMDAIQIDTRISQSNRNTKYMSKLWEDFTSWKYLIEELLKDPRAYNYFELYNLNPSGSHRYPENYKKFYEKIYDYLIWKWLINPSINFDSWSFNNNYKLTKLADWKVQLQVLSNISKNWQNQTIDF